MLLGSSSGKTNGKRMVKTMLLLFGSMLGNGSTILLQTLFRTCVPDGSVSAYSFLQFAIPAVVLYGAGIGMAAGDGRKLPRVKGKLLWLTVAASVAVLFPISDGGGTVISAVVAATVFKERFTWKSGLGVTAMVAIKLFAA